MLPHYLWKIRVQICDKLSTRSTFSLISYGVCRHLKDLIDLSFVDPGMKLNGGYYRHVLLSQQL